MGKYIKVLLRKSDWYLFHRFLNILWVLLTGIQVERPASVMLGKAIRKESVVIASCVSNHIPLHLSSSEVASFEPLYRIYPYEPLKNTLNYPIS